MSEVFEREMCARFNELNCFKELNRFNVNMPGDDESDVTISDSSAVKLTHESINTHM